LPSLLDEAVDVSELDSKVKALIYGPRGSLKSTFAGGAPKAIIFDFERSADSIKFVNPNSDARVLRIRKDKHTPEQVFKAMRDALKPESPYETLVIDTIDRMQLFYVRDLVKKANRNPPIPLWQDYRLATESLDEFFVDCQNSDKHVLFISHALDEYIQIDEKTKKFVGIRPALQPTLAKRVSDIINVVGYMTLTVDARKNKLHTLQIAPTSEKIVAKNRLGIEEPIHNDPTWESIFVKRGK
jgi:hypothetical protein